MTDKMGFCDLCEFAVGPGGKRCVHCRRAYEAGAKAMQGQAADALRPEYPDQVRLITALPIVQPPRQEE